MRIINAHNRFTRVIEGLNPRMGMAALAMLVGAMVALDVPEAQAHGYVSVPKSRVLQCKENGIENPTNPACIAAKAAGNSGFYTPQGIAGGGVYYEDPMSPQIYDVADGELCSGGVNGYAGLDLARSDWPTTQVTPGPFTFEWTNTAQHITSYFSYWITREGHDHSQPLKWSDLDYLGAGSFNEPRVPFSYHTMDLPYRTGKHIVYSIWQRSPVDAKETFYQCVDIDFGNGTGAPSSSSSSSSSSSLSSISSSSSSSSAVNENTCSSLAVWSESDTYTSPTQVQYAGKRYQAKWWTQGNNPATNSDQHGAWIDLGACTSTPISSSSSSSAISSSSSSSISSSVSSSSASSTAPTGNCDSPVFVQGTSYSTNALVQANGNEYKCLVSGWCTIGGPYAPGSGWAWGNAWSLERSCQ